MELAVSAVWSGPDILVRQTFLHGATSRSEWIELSMGHAELLIQELQDAIKECRRMDQEYENDMRNGDALQNDLRESAIEVQI